MTMNDCISRQAVLEQTYLWSKDEFLRVTNPFDYLRKRINSLSPVNPQEPKIGYWEWVQYDENPKIGNFHCSECRYIPAIFNMSAQKLNYCPNCGARMFEPQESEVNNG